MIGGYGKTAILMAGMTALFMAFGYALGAEVGLAFAFILALGMNFYTYWNSGTLVLRHYRAQELTQDSNHPLYVITAQMAEKAGMPIPKVYIINNPQPNAFATGRNPENAAVAATTGLLNHLSQQEIAGVMAHELAHIKNRDTLIMTVSATMAGAISMLANFALFFGGGRDNRMGFIAVLAMAILAPLAASLVQMAVSRSREYEADRIGAEICGHPDWLASALEKISYGAQRIDNHAAERNPATAHMFIINPLHAHRIDRLFATHPPTDERIRLLRAMRF